jgi:pseudaminic acid cytidylyltransferase
MSAIAIITARGGSKRIPRKNIKNFCGKPILQYSIEAALGSEMFDEVMVSTDDREIAEIAKECGANIPFFRSDKTSGDYASTEDVLVEVINEYKKNGKEFDTYCCIYPTAPFLTGGILREAVRKFEAEKADFMTPVVRFSYPPQRCQIIENGQLVRKWPEYKYTRSQDLEPWYHDAGQFYIGNIECLLKNGMSNGVNIPYIMEEIRVQDIDTEEDWKIAEMKFRLIN